MFPVDGATGIPVADIIGSAGVFLILLAYFLLQAEKLGSRNPVYSLMNMTGSLLILVSLSFNFNFASVLIETLWALISAYGLWRTVRRTRNT